MTFGSLFAGIGGFDLGFERAGLRCVWQVEIDPWCRRVLTKHWPDVPKWDDVKTFTGDGFERPDVICGGFPCQDISRAGNRKPRVGLDGERSGLWLEYARIIRGFRPRYVVVENVPDVLYRGFSRVVGDLAACGYDTEWECIPASAVGAPQPRYRTFLVAHSSGERVQGFFTGTVPRFAEFSWCQDVRRPADFFGRPGIPEPLVRRSGNGFSAGVDRLRGLGNAVVPQVAEWIGRRLMGSVSNTNFKD